jgi:transposase
VAARQASHRRSSCLAAPDAGGGHAAVQADEYVVGTSSFRDLERRVRDLERLLCPKTMKNEILKGALTSLAYNGARRAIPEQCDRRVTVSAVARTLGQWDRGH